MKTLENGLDQGTMNGAPAWFAWSAQFRNEREAHLILPRMRHTGWFGDTENQEKLHVGIVAGLSHGRFIAGYLSNDFGERVYFPEVFTDENEAARMADEHARVAAECEDEYSQRFNEAMRLDGLIDDKLSEVERSFALRNHPRLGANEREMVSGHIRDIRAFRQERENLKVD